MSVYGDDMKTCGGGCVMKCEVCGRGMSDGVTLFRVNDIGVKGIWRCKTHLTIEQESSINEEVKHITDIIESENRRKENGY